MDVEIATLAGGCFWCTEAVFRRLNGVISVLPGYASHAEAIQIEFNPEKISFDKILDVFWHTHNPTTLNQQGADVGPEYRSVIFYHGMGQKEIAEKSKIQFEKEGEYKDPIVTEIVPFTNFYEAEDYHKNYYEKHKNALYCNLVINPKIKKLMKMYGGEVKEEYRS